MAEAESTPDTGTQTPAAQPIAPPQQQTPPPPQQNSNSGNGPGQQILDALNALPERITNSLREALQPPAHSGTPTANQGNGSGSGSTGTTGQQESQAATGQSGTAAQSSGNSASSSSPSDKEPGKKTFAQWWFGG
jgi:hypothetical protein